MNFQNKIKKSILALIFITFYSQTWGGNVTVLTIGNPPVTSRTAGYHVADQCAVNHYSGVHQEIGHGSLSIDFIDPTKCTNFLEFNVVFINDEGGQVNCDLQNFVLNNDANNLKTGLTINYFVRPKNSGGCKFLIQKKVAGSDFSDLKIATPDLTANHSFYTSSVCTPVISCSGQFLTRIKHAEVCGSSGIGQEISYARQRIYSHNQPVNFEVVQFRDDLNPNNPDYEWSNPADSYEPSQGGPWELRPDPPYSNFLYHSFLSSEERNTCYYNYLLDPLGYAPSCPSDFVPPNGDHIAPGVFCEWNGFPELSRVRP
jgi:hypothetical protein